MVADLDHGIEAQNSSFAGNKSAKFNINLLKSPPPILVTKVTNYATF